MRFGSETNEMGMKDRIATTVPEILSVQVLEPGRGETIAQVQAFEMTVQERGDPVVAGFEIAFQSPGIDPAESVDSAFDPAFVLTHVQAIPHEPVQTIRHLGCALTG